uniref:Nif11 domain-containing protein n=1 Tax=Cyanothece sp. (strain PCC 7425 / ATCC 29141) TaxID=395961 RepID=B8HVI1_CYAP4
MNINIEKFFQFAVRNGQLQEILKDNNSTREIVKVATENGYYFTEAELQVALNQIYLSKEDEAELNDYTLSSIAGGIPSRPWPTQWNSCGYTCGC